VNPLRDPRPWCVFLLGLLLLGIGLDLTNRWTLSARHIAQSADTPFASIPQPVGYDRAAVPIDYGHPTCAAYRFSSGQCGYCRQDAPRFLLLERELRKAGCRTLVIAPTAGNEPPETNNASVDGPFLLSYVDPAFAAATTFSVTPTTVIVKADLVIWSKIGVLQAEDVAAALASVRETGQHEN
jgi:hypothetical protein